MNASEKVSEILRRLKLEYPEPGTELKFNTPFELLVATILSAQTTDIQVNKVTEGLFNKYKTIRDYAKAPGDIFQKDISSVNFYKTKARNIQASASMLIDKFSGEVPSTLEELTLLPGVARKTANIILYNAFRINEGIAVDTHVKRVSYRLGLTEYNDPVRIEKDLMGITKQREWGNLTHLLISHGRAICHAKKPKHSKCILYDICPSRET
ncbi:MAG: endonuclease III [Nitrospirae bacterium]|nr:endonuclease III [Nitrospirota bacterium]